jgi:uncharacterized membrane protein HdeD (DUF308 family)
MYSGSTQTVSDDAVKRSSTPASARGDHVARARGLTVGRLPGPRWLSVVVGALGVLAGVVVLAVPEISLVTLAVIGGIFLITDGIVEVTSAVLDRRTGRGWTVVFGVITVIIGALLIRHPIGGVLAIAMLLGIWLMTTGVIRLLRTLADHGSVWSALLAVLEVVAGVVIVSRPGIGVTTLALLVGIAWIVRGFTMVAIGWMGRDR